MSIFKKYFFFFVILISSVNVWGQAARSPYTSFGIGEPYGSALINTQGMAGVGVSQPQFYINNQNPALLVFNSFTMFQAGLLAERRTIKSSTSTEKNVGGNMNYLVTAFPIYLTKWTTSVGLMPYTTVKYKIQYIDNIANSPDQVNVSEEGKGGLSQLYWANGVRLHPNFSVGVKAAYIFSSITNSYRNQLITTNQPINYYATIQDKLLVKDFALTTGISYSRDSLFRQNKYRLSIGAVYGLSTDLKTKQRQTIFRSISKDDTLNTSILLSRKGSIYVPASITVGISLSYTSKWTIGTEFSYQNWSNFRNINNVNEGLGNSWRIALGGERTPDRYGESYIKRITYRTGVSMEQYPFSANNKVVKDVGINFGFSIPSSITGSSLDVAFKYGKRGNKADNILEEDYFKIYFGITFGDRWFVKRKFD